MRCAGIATRGLICLPESVITHNVAFIIDRKCGSHAADLVRRYYLYYRARFNSVLNKMGFPTNICDKVTGSLSPTTYTSHADTESDDGTHRRLLDQFLEENSPGTAMDTAYGLLVRTLIASVPDREFCAVIGGLGTSFTACRLLSYDPSGKARFNILQYAHSDFALPFTPFPDSSSLNLFRSCWDLLQQICGANTTYLYYTYHVSAGSREIQRMMDNLTCVWQDTLTQQYIDASERGNIWPTALNTPARPMLLSNGRYTFGSLTTSMSDLISVVNRVVNELSERCSMGSAERIKLFYHRLNYGWYTHLKICDILQKKMLPSHIYRRLVGSEINQGL